MPVDRQRRCHHPHGVATGSPQTAVEGAVTVWVHGPNGVTVSADGKARILADLGSDTNRIANTCRSPIAKPTFTDLKIRYAVVADPGQALAPPLRPLWTVPWRTTSTRTRGGSSPAPATPLGWRSRCVPRRPRRRDRPRPRGPAMSGVTLALGGGTLGTGT